MRKSFWARGLVVVGLLLPTMLLLPATVSGQWAGDVPVDRGEKAPAPGLEVLPSEPLWIVHEGTASGTLDGQPFGTTGRVGFVLRATADLSERTFQNGTTIVYQVPHRTALMTIEGVGTVELLTPTRTFVNNDTQRVGFSRNVETSLADLFHGPVDAAFATWDMSTAIGPITSTGLTLQWNLEPAILTNAGILFVDTMFAEVDPATFQMFTSEVFADDFEDGTTDAWELNGNLE